MAVTVVELASSRLSFNFVRMPLILVCVGTSAVAVFMASVMQTRSTTDSDEEVGGAICKAELMRLPTTVLPSDNFLSGNGFHRVGLQLEGMQHPVRVLQALAGLAEAATRLFNCNLRLQGLLAQQHWMKEEALQLQQRLMALEDFLKLRKGGKQRRKESKQLVVAKANTIKRTGSEASSLARASNKGGLWRMGSGAGTGRGACPCPRIWTHVQC